jgi:hypothetical protein
MDLKPEIDGIGEERLVSRTLGESREAEERKRRALGRTGVSNQTPAQSQGPDYPVPRSELDDVM